MARGERWQAEGSRGLGGFSKSCCPGSMHNCNPPPPPNCVPGTAVPKFAPSHRPPGQQEGKGERRRSSGNVSPIGGMSDICSASYSDDGSKEDPSPWALLPLAPSAGQKEVRCTQQGILLALQTKGGSSPSSTKGRHLQTWHLMNTLTRWTKTRQEPQSPCPPELGPAEQGTCPASSSWGIWVLRTLGRQQGARVTVRNREGDGGLGSRSAQPGLRSGEGHSVQLCPLPPEQLD